MEGSQSGRPHGSEILAVVVFREVISVTGETDTEVVFLRDTGDALVFVVTQGPMEVVGNSIDVVVVIFCVVGILADKDVLSVECLEVKGGKTVGSVVLNGGAMPVVVVGDTSVTFSVVELPVDIGDIGIASVVVVGDLGLSTVLAVGDSGLASVLVVGDLALTIVLVVVDLGLTSVLVVSDVGLVSVLAVGDLGLTNVLEVGDLGMIVVIVVGDLGPAIVLLDGAM